MSLPSSLDGLVAETDFNINAKSIPESSSFFMLDNSKKLSKSALSRTMLSTGTFYNQTSENTPFLVYTKFSNFDKMEKF